jgi:guanidinoacetate N-methyltransferase
MPETGVARAYRAASGDGFRLELHTDPDFISPPRDVQRRWLLGRAVEEFTEDLQQLAVTAASLVRGTELRLDSRGSSGAGLTEQEIMEDWQVPLMQAMARHVTEAHGDVLEIGFGRGVSAELIQQRGVRTHTIVEPDDHIITRYFDPWRAKHPGPDIRLRRGRWQDLEDRLGQFDGIFFHAVPQNEEEFAEYMLGATTFAEHAFGPMARHLRPGGVLTYLSTEIDSLSRRHQRRLFEHFLQVTLSVESLQVPEDTQDMWWAKSMVVVSAVK